MPVWFASPCRSSPLPDFLCLVDEDEVASVCWVTGETHRPPVIRVGGAIFEPSHFLPLICGDKDGLDEFPPKRLRVDDDRSSNLRSFDHGPAVLSAELTKESLGY